MDWNLISIIAFYSLLALFFFKKRRNIERQGIFILYKTKSGLNLISKLAKKYNKFLRYFGKSAIYIGFAGIVFILILLSKSAIEIFTKPATQAGVALAIPGVKIPGSPIFIPFWYGILSLIIVLIVHEGCHGLVAKANGLKLKSAGVGLLAFLPLAFVEPLEDNIKEITEYYIKKLRKKDKKLNTLLKDKKKYRKLFDELSDNINKAIPKLKNKKTITLNLEFHKKIELEITKKEIDEVRNEEYKKRNGSLEGSPLKAKLAVFGAGPLANFTTALIIVGLTALLIPVISATFEPSGLNIISVREGFPADKAGLTEDDVILSVNGRPSLDMINFSEEVNNVSPGEIITISTEDEKFEVNSTEDPENKSQAYIGISFTQLSRVKGSISSRFGEIPWILVYLREFFKWIFILNVGIGAINLLPLGPIDGGRMLHDTLLEKMKNKELARRILGYVSYFSLFLLIINIIGPYIMS